MNPSPTDPRSWPMSPTEPAPAPPPEPLAEAPREMPAVAASPAPNPVTASADPFPSSADPFTASADPFAPSPDPCAGSAPSPPALPRPTQPPTTAPQPPRTPPQPPRTAMRPVDVGPGRKTHSGRLLAIGLAVLALLGGSATAVWRLNSRTPATPLVSSTTAPGTGDVALGSAPPSAGAGPVAALSTAAPSPSQSSPAPSKAAATTGAPSGLVDNFSGTTLDTDRWGVYSATASNGGILSPSAVRVTGGQLQIIGTGTNATGKGNVAGGLCWCGTGGDRLYGIWQVRARFDAGAGYGAIIGLWPNSDDASTTGYISAVNMPGAARTSLYGQVVWPGGADSGDVTGDFTAWHTYTIEWRATFVRLSLDGKVYYDSTKSTAKPVIPHVPLHLYTQVAVGPSDDVPAPDASTPAHVIMHYDWVKMLP